MNIRRSIKLISMVVGIISAWIVLFMSFIVGGLASQTLPICFAYAIATMIILGVYEVFEAIRIGKIEDRLERLEKRWALSGQKVD